MNFSSLWRWALLVALLVSARAYSAQPEVVATLKPIHSLASAVMGNTGTAKLILDGVSDPHSHSMRPSQARAIENADLLIWIGPIMEQSLKASIKNLSAETTVLTLLDIDGLLIPRARDGHSSHDHEAEQSETDQSVEQTDSHDHTHEHEHEHARDTTIEAVSDDEGRTDAFNLDPHIWLNPDNAAMIAIAIRDALTDINPDHAAAYERNTAALTARIKALDDRLGERLLPLKNLRYLVAHDAYQAFEQHYDLLPGGVLRINPAVSPGARRLRELRKFIFERGIECVLAEPGFSFRLLQVLTDNTSARVSTVDALGSALPAGASQWFTLMDDVTTGFERCRQSD